MSVDCRFVASDAGTVHEQSEYHGEGREYRARPKCGQTLPPESAWNRVDAESVAELEEQYNLSFCSKCFSPLSQVRRARDDGGGE